jgi:hypothetical protein
VSGDSAPRNERSAGLLPDGSSPRIIAAIWATVDLDRSVAAEGLPAEKLPDDPLLGARVRLVRPPTGPAIALVEPSTEGRLAALLARQGEGPAGHYLEAPEGFDRVRERGPTAGVRLGRTVAGPFGPEALVDGPIGAPLQVLVEPPAGTIGR